MFGHKHPALTARELEPLQRDHPGRPHYSRGLPSFTANRSIHWQGLHPHNCPEMCTLFTHLIDGKTKTWGIKSLSQSSTAGTELGLNRHLSGSQAPANPFHNSTCRLPVACGHPCVFPMTLNIYLYPGQQEGQGYKWLCSLLNVNQEHSSLTAFLCT